MGPDGRSIYFSLTLSIGIERRSAGVQDMMLQHGMPLQRGARLRIAYCLNDLLWAALVS